MLTIINQPPDTACRRDPLSVTTTASTGDGVRKLILSVALGAVVLLGLSPVDAASARAADATGGAFDAPRPVVYLNELNGAVAYDFRTGLSIPLQAPYLGSTNVRPQGLVVSGDGRRLYAFSKTDALVWVIDTATNAPLASIPVGAVPMGMVLSPDGRRLYVTSQSTASLSVIDTATNTVIATVPGFRQSTMLAVSHDGQHVFATSLYADGHWAIIVLDTATTTVTASVTVDRAPVSLTMSPDGSRLYFVDTNNTPSVQVFDPVTWTVVAKFPLDRTAVSAAVSPDGSRVYVLETSALLTLDAATGAVLSTVADAHLPTTMALSPDGGAIYLSNYLASSEFGAHLDVVDLATGTLSQSAVPAATTIAFATVAAIDGPTAKLTLSTCDCGTVTASPQISTPGFFPIVTEMLDYGDGSLPTEAQTHHYTVAGSYKVTLTVTDVSGRTSTTSAWTAFVLPVQAVIGIRASNGAYLRASDPFDDVTVDHGPPAAAGGSATKLTRDYPVLADGTQPENFSIIRVGGDRVVIRSDHSGFVRTVTALHNEVFGGEPDFAAATVYQLVHNSDGSFSLLDTALGRYLTSNDGMSPVSASATSIGAPESFTAVDSYTNLPVTLTAAQKASAGAPGGGTAEPVIVGWSRPGQRLAAR
jgi:YVTN family beta-propeller protein